MLQIRILVWKVRTMWYQNYDWLSWTILIPATYFIFNSIYMWIHIEFYNYGHPFSFSPTTMPLWLNNTLRLTGIVLIWISSSVIKSWYGDRMKFHYEEEREKRSTIAEAFHNAKKK